MRGAWPPLLGVLLAAASAWPLGATDQPALSDEVILIQVTLDAAAPDTEPAKEVNATLKDMFRSAIKTRLKSAKTATEESSVELKKRRQPETVPPLNPAWPQDYITDDSPGAEDIGGHHPDTHSSGPMHRVSGHDDQTVLPHKTVDGEPGHVAGHHNHGYLCLAFLLGSLGLGCLLQMFQERFMQRVPYTCMLFLLGWIFAAIHHVRPKDHWSAWPTWFISVDIWEQIDPHLVFYVFLPILIFVEAMRLNVKMAAKCFSQVMVLACPGVLLGTVLTAVFARYCFPYGWSWPTALIFGSILSATDPVAVVSLFQTLGVSARLTMVISGESLLNDGTAIVLFELMLKILLGGSITAGFTVLFIIRMALISVVLGVALAFAGLTIISWCAESNYHTDSMIQVVVTICLSFLCFFLAENECGTSGVLTVVSAGCVFSYVAWPRFVSKETIRTVWEALEFVGNTLIFLLAGLLFAHKCLSRSPVLRWRDLGFLILLYIVVTLIRGLMILVMWPVLNLLGQRLCWQEITVMIWSGLRGAVGLVLAISLDLEPSISHEIGSHIIFHVGGIAMLTICINSTTCGPLLKMLEMTKAPEIEDQTMAHLAKVADEHTLDALDQITKSNDPRFQGANVDVVKTLVPSLAHCIEEPSQGAKAPDVASKLRIYREIFMRTVQRHYWTDIEQGMIPKNSRIARILLYSTDEALSNPKQSLNDWDTVMENIDHNFRPLQRLCNVWPLRLVTALQQWFPSAHTVSMWKVYAALSFVEAHQGAQAQVPTFFSRDSVLDLRIQDQVNKESGVQCEKASAMLKSIPAELIELGKSRMMAGKMLQLQLENVTSLHEEGILHERGATQLMHHIHMVQREVVGRAFAGKGSGKALQTNDEDVK
mmetsp:Transcript_34381/g.106750  ORF Transcript_34381/g.106750 Transcript_34381/m.106750 type:complete len:880 (-) Transcript_34381:66-2705(-)